MSYIDTASAQRFLQARGTLAAGGVDGDWGPRSKAAARQALAALSSEKTSYKPAWPDERVRIAVEQALMASVGIDVGIADGIAGVRTQVGLEKWQDHITFVRPSPNPTAGVGAATRWPLQKDVRAFYGEPGQHQVRVTSPYPLYLDWALGESLTSFLCHEKVKPSIERVLANVLSYYGLNQIHALGLDQFGGCLNVRRMRNGSAWSMHAWGIAIDWDADRNKLRETSRTARMAQPAYAPFLDFWAAEGWVSLGRARNFDWMHVQAARL